MTGRLATRLADNALRLAWTAAVLGTPCPVGELAAVMARPVPAVVADLATLDSAGILHDSADLLVFRQELLARAVAVGPSARRRLHRYAAQALAEVRIRPPASPVPSPLGAAGRPARA
ncbi:hypothetical protein [Streptomyces gardneri]|uniref:hypothetical protein n=1 Tax=Streptomyces gardneri TaxID=66892 RepID=UPI003692DA5E